MYRKCTQTTNGKYDAMTVPAQLDKQDKLKINQRVANAQAIVLVE